MEHKKSKGRFLRHSVSVPFVFITLIPLVLLDITIEIYHRVCFPLYGLEYVRRKDYIKIDRHRLKYLNPFNKIACAYCGYANGMANYTTKIAGITEAYWCGIKHEKTKGFVEQAHHKSFLDYGDEKAFKKKYSR